MSKKIKLTGKRGGYALVDEADFEWLSKYKWNHMTLGYCCRYVGSPRAKAVMMHREVMGFPECEVDHINHNKLDNRRSNLRACSRRSNATNSGSVYPRGKYGRNVALIKGNRKKPFLVTCWKNCKQVHGGYYATPEEAQTAAAKLRRKLDYFA